MKLFVPVDSIVRKIWGRGDTILFIFAGASAEFALNKAVDWLYFTGRLPADPLNRLFSTVTYARQIIFSEQNAALRAIDKITAIHKQVEESRGAEIPGEAYRDVLFMLIDYSIRSFELLERKLYKEEKIEVFETFYRVGLRMQLAGLPCSFAEWEVMREEHLLKNLVYSGFTLDLYRQYQRQLGRIRYWFLIQVQQLLVPQSVQRLLSFSKINWLIPLLHLYKICRIMKLDGALKKALLPAAYRAQIQKLDMTDDTHGKKN